MEKLNENEFYMLLKDAEEKGGSTYYWGSIWDDTYPLVSTEKDFKELWEHYQECFDCKNEFFRLYKFGNEYRFTFKNEKLHKIDVYDYYEDAYTHYMFEIKEEEPVEEAGEPLEEEELMHSINMLNKLFN